MIQTIIKGSGHHLGEKIIKNEDFLESEFYESKGVKSTKPNSEIIEKLQKITDIKERRYLRDDLLNSDQAKIAGQKAIEDSKLDKEELDYIIVAHNYGDIKKGFYQSDFMPSLAAKVKNKLGIKNIRCKPYDMIFGCPGWVEALILSDQLIKSKVAKHILVVGSESLSRVLDPYDRNSMIFADGAGAVILSGVETKEKIGILSYDTRCDNNEEIDYLANNSSLNPNYKNSSLNISMQGKKIYEYALRLVPTFVKNLLDRSHLEIKDIAKILIHQANAKMDHAILERLLKLYEIAYDEKKHSKLMPMTIEYLGNTSVATIPTLLDKVLKKELNGHKIHLGDKIIMVSLGAGMHINGIIYKLP